MSLVVDGLRCKRCNGTMHETDLAKYLVMDVETYGSVIWDILLMDMVERNCVYASGVRSSMIYRN